MAAVKVASWNVNSIKARLPNVVEWLESANPDVVALQELKCQADGFPQLEIEAAGYKTAVVGQKSYNGVALLSKHEIEVTAEALPGDDSDEQARYIEGRTAGLRIGGLYLPNGNPVASEKFPYKLAWMERLRRRAAELLKSEEKVLLLGDYNVIPEEEDCYDPKAWEGDALFRKESRQAFQALINLGLTDVFRALHPRAARAFTFWDYQGGAWDQDHGIRIDHILASPQAADALKSCEIDKTPRGKKKASDHTPILCEIEI